MTVLGLSILLSLLGTTGLRLLANALTLTSLRAEGPTELSSSPERSRYQKARRYTAARTKFESFALVFDLALILAFWLGGGFQILDTEVRGLGLGMIRTGLLYVGVLVVGKAMLSIPLGLYATFSLEERFGFNRMTLGAFFRDSMKEIALIAIVGGPALAGFFWLFGEARRGAWVYAWIFATALFLLAVHLAPRVILPWFNRFEPLPDGELRAKLHSYAATMGHPIGAIRVMDGSKRSSKSSAFLIGFGPSRRLVLFDTLMERHTIPEIVSIVAHEIGHSKRRHIPVRLAVSVLQIGVMLWLFSFLIEWDGLFRAFDVEQSSLHLGLCFGLVLYQPFALLLSIPLNWLFRRQEDEADRFAVETTGYPDAFAEALRKLALDNLCNPAPHSLSVVLNDCHPTIQHRLDAARALASEIQEPTHTHPGAGPAPPIDPTRSAATGP